MTNLEIIKELKQSTFTDEDGEDYKLEFQAGLTDEEINVLSESYPSKNIPDELVQILSLTKGWDGYGPEMVYFDSIGVFGFTELSPNSISLGTDGCGNYWVLDIASNGELGKVFFACHDPAVFVINSQNLNEHLNHLLAFYKNPSESALISIDSNLTFDIWKHGNNLISKAEFKKQNPEYHDFLNKFDGDQWTVADLRKGSNQDGFPWGKIGSNHHTERHPTELIWIMKNKKKGFLSNLFGKRY